MNTPSDEDPDLESQRNKIIGLGELSIRKSYYPELQQQQVALKESEARLRSILHASPVMQFVIDNNHRVISWNKAIETYSGIKADDMTGTDGQWRAFYPQKRPVLADLLVDESLHLPTSVYREKFSKSRLVEDGYEVIDFFPNMGESGKWLYATAVPIRDAWGTIIGAVETLEDITDRKIAEDALKKSEKFLNNVIENIPDMIFVKDARDLRFVLFNKAGEDLVGFSREDLYGKNDYDFFPKDEADFFTTKDRAVLNDRQVVDIPEETIRTRRRGERILHTKKISVPGDDGKPGYLMGISEDITERKWMENALQLARKKMNLLNAVTFKDIQSAAFTMHAYHELMENSITDEKIRSYLAKEAEARQVIIDSLNFAKNYQDMGIQPPRWQSLIHVFLYAISHLDFQHIARDFRVDGLEIYADPLLVKVFENLIDNSLRHGERVQHITVSILQYGLGEIAIEYADDGIGVHDEDKERIFEKGFGKNTGLGLFLIREILSITGLTMKESGMYGSGVLFEIFIPKEKYRFSGTHS